MIIKALKIRSLATNQARVVIQGFGNAGSYLAQFLYELGARVVGISDVYGAIYDEDGLDIPNLLERRDSFGTVTKLFANTLTNQQLLEQKCDILVPAAIENQITQDNAARIQAAIVVEAANGPTTLEATSILTERGVLIVPDILANAGGVVVSYYEWVQNNQGYYWTKAEVETKLQEIIENAFDNVYNIHETYGVNMRLAAYMAGVQKMAEASHLRGWI
jgi:glutamate dehydrogenase